MHHPLLERRNSPGDVLYTREASAERGNFFRFQVYEKQERSEKVGISFVEEYERLGKYAKGA